MWTETTRGHYERQSVRYSTDLTNKEFFFDRRIIARQKVSGPPTQHGFPRGDERDPVSPSHGLPMGDVAEGLAAQRYGVRLFPFLEARRGLGAGSSQAADGGARTMWP